MAILITCPHCNSTVQPERDLTCPNCSELLDNEIFAFAYKYNSDNLLIFHKDGSVNKANIKHLAKGHSPIGDTALVIGISYELFNVLTPDIHDRTSPNSPYGKLLPNQPDDIYAVLKVLRQNAVPYSESEYVHTPTKPTATPTTSLPVVATSKYRVNWTIVDRNDRRMDKSLEVEAADERAAKAMVPDADAVNVWVTKLESLTSNFADEFKLYENLWS